MIYILRHCATNHLGSLISPLDRHGLPYTYVLMPEYPLLTFGDLRDVQAVIILGGAMNVDDVEAYPFLRAEQTLIRTLVTERIPLFGICLGGQLIARSLGASVRKNPIKEVGWTPVYLTRLGKTDPVLGPLGSPHWQFQWHEDRFELPSGAVHLAHNPQCDYQAYRLGSKIYGVQFHPEITLPVIEAWLDEAQSLTDAEKEMVRLETKIHYSNYETHNIAMMERYLKHISLIPGSTTD